MQSCVFEEKYLKPLLAEYKNRFLGYPINRFMRKYASIEKKIAENAKSLVSNYLAFAGFSSDNDIILIDNIHCKVLYEFIKSDRIIKVTFNSLTRGMNEKSLKLDIDHVGAVKSIVVEYPAHLAPLYFTELIELLYKYYIGTYTILEFAFDSHSVFLNKIIFNEINNRIKVQLRASEKEHLENKLVLTVFHKETGFHFLDRDLFKSALKHYKCNQERERSPIELTVWLVSKSLSFPDSLSSEAFKEGRSVSQYWKDAKFIISSNEFWRAASNYFGTDDKYFVYPLLNKRSYYLTLVFNESYETQVLPEIEAVKDELSEVFEKGIGSFSAHIKTLKELNSTITHSYSTLADFLGQLIGSTVITLGKGSL